MMKRQKNPLIIGHRGAAGEAPENTLASFQLALEQGSDAIELDVHLTREGELVVCHDAALDRTTTGTGRITEMTLEEIRAVDAGIKFNSRFAGQRVPLLSEVFGLVPAGCMVNVEIKYDTPGLRERLVELLDATNRRKNVVISSFDHKCLRRLKSDAPDLRIGLLYRFNPVDHAGLADLFGGDVYSLHPHYSLIVPEDIKRADGRGLQVYPYTVNGEADMRRLIDAGVSGIITDYPARLRALLA